MKLEKVIFDLDGTLYRFHSERAISFGQSQFYADLRQRIIAFLGAHLGVDDQTATGMLEAVNTEYDGELSIGFERRYGIDRHIYYAATWACEPADYVPLHPDLSAEMAPFAGRALLLTAAPRIWALRVLDHLGLRDVFGDLIITGEPDLRKPDPAVFALAAERLGIDPAQIISVGDQNHSDILPAKALGMTTVLIGPDQLDADHRATNLQAAITLIKEKLQ